MLLVDLVGRLEMDGCGDRSAVANIVHLRVRRTRNHHARLADAGGGSGVRFTSLTAQFGVLLCTAVACISVAIRPRKIVFPTRLRELRNLHLKHFSSTEQYYRTIAELNTKLV